MGTEFYSLEGSLSGELFQRGSEGSGYIEDIPLKKKKKVVEHQKFTANHTHTHTKLKSMNLALFMYKMQRAWTHSFDMHPILSQYPVLLSPEFP